MNKYIGVTEDDMPHKGGAWVVKNKDAHEQWNFLNYNGYCYGFVMNSGEQFAIERIDKSASNADSVDGVTVVWCALNEKDETVIVGWYENATVYRFYENSITTPISGIYRSYCSSAKSEDCYLLPEHSRKFVIGRASRDGSGKGFGQKNFWYAESPYARQELIPEVLRYLEAHKDERINRIDRDFQEPQNVLEPLSDYERSKADELYDNNECFDFLPYGYRLFNMTKSADDAYYIADALTSLHQYSSAIIWYNKVIDIEGKSWNVNGNLAYLYQQCCKYEKSIELAFELLKYSEASDLNARDELYSIIADDYYNLDNIEEAISWLDRIIAESTNKDLVNHTFSVKKNWSELL